MNCGICIYPFAWWSYTAGRLAMSNFYYLPQITCTHMRAKDRLRYKHIALPLLIVDIHMSGANQQHTMLRTLDLWFTIVAAWDLAPENITWCCHGMYERKSWSNHAATTVNHRSKVRNIVCCCFAPDMHFWHQKWGYYVLLMLCCFSALVRSVQSVKVISRTQPSMGCCPRTKMNVALCSNCMVRAA